MPAAVKASRSRLDIPLRIVVADPLPGLTLKLQRGATGKGDLLEPTVASTDALVFDFDALMESTRPDGRPRLLGPFVQGPPDGRFVYICVGQGAGQMESPFNGRMKVPLGGLTVALVESLAKGRRLEARVSGRGRNGGPAYATVPILPPGWESTQ